MEAGMTDSSDHTVKRGSKRGASETTPARTDTSESAQRRGTKNAGVPRGIDALIKKAAVDATFRKSLLEKRAEAAHEIGLELVSSEKATLNSLPAARIEQIIENTTVPNHQRRIFLGKIGSAMFAALGLYVPAHGYDSMGHRGDFPQRPRILHFPMKVDPRNACLKIEVVSEEDNAVDVEVTYHCPYSTGELSIFFIRDNTDKKLGITYFTEKSQIVSGDGAKRFRCELAGVVTDWLIVRLRKNVDNRRDFLKFYVGWRMSNSPEGEYSVDEPALFRIMKFRKEWSNHKPEYPNLHKTRQRPSEGPL
jgi:hypothetical protein